MSHHVPQVLPKNYIVFHCLASIVSSPLLLNNKNKLCSFVDVFSRRDLSNIQLPFYVNTFDFPVQRNVCYQNDIFRTFFSSLFNSFLLRVIIEIILQSMLRLFITYATEAIKMSRHVIN